MVHAPADFLYIRPASRLFKGWPSGLLLLRVPALLPDDRGKDDNQTSVGREMNRLT